MADSELHRHDWVWLDRPWPDHLFHDLAPDDHSALSDWQARDRPFVVARRLTHDQPPQVRLGLALPGRRRIGLLVGKAAIVRRADPPALADLAASLPKNWQKRVANLLDLPCRIGVFGSAAWQCFAARSDLVYLTPESDLDLLLSPTSWRQAEETLDTLCSLADGRPRLDGEILLPDGAAVAWREWALTAQAELLVKSIDGVALRERAAIRELFLS